LEAVRRSPRGGNRRNASRKIDAPNKPEHRNAGLDPPDAASKAIGLLGFVQSGTCFGQGRATRFERERKKRPRHWRTKLAFCSGTRRLARAVPVGDPAPQRLPGRHRQAKSVRRFSFFFFVLGDNQAKPKPWESVSFYMFLILLFCR